MFILSVNADTIDKISSQKRHEKVGNGALVKGCLIDGMEKKSIVMDSPKVGVKRNTTPHAARFKNIKSVAQSPKAVAPRRTALRVTP